MVDVIPTHAITIWQPSASLICPGPHREPIKRIETRSWATKHRGPVLICSAAKRTPYGITGWLTGQPHELHWGPNHVPWPTPDALPLGAALGVATIVDCLPMTTHHDIGDPECIVVHGDGTLDHAIPSWHADRGPTEEDRAQAAGFELVHIAEVEVPDGAALITDISDQEILGDFTPGRFGWMLDDIISFAEPIPVKGGQKLWRVDNTDNPHLAERLAHVV